MAAGQPYLVTDADRWLFGVLSVDALLQEYAPGGFWSNDPDQVVNEAWQSTVTYAFGDMANGPDEQPYHSLINGNVGNNPTTSPAAWQLCFPCVRWWMQAPGRDVKRQDGRAGRAESQPTFVVCMLDRQHGGSIDKVGGSNGHLEDGSLRLVSLLDARNEVVTLTDGRTFQFAAFQQFAYQMIEPAHGGFNVMVGHQYQFRIQ
jgi:hypothetical protein